MIYQPVPDKRCTKCRQWKQWLSSEFRNRSKRKALNPSCRECERVYSIQRYARDPEKRRAERKAYYYSHRETEIAKSNHWSHTHLERGRQYDKKRREKHRDKLLERSRNYAAKHRVEASARSSKWVKDHPDKHRQHGLDRYARKRKLASNFTIQDWDRALAYWHGCCAYCGNPPSLFDRDYALHHEHFVPTTKQGAFIPSNIVPACQTCNFSKKDADAEYWVNWRFGKRRGKEILKRIQEYFDWIATQDNEHHP